MNYSHGLSDSRIHRIWANMKTRCLNEHVKHYHRYGGRGITICDEWLNDFKSFYDWSMSHGYDDDLTLDRIDNNGNYEPSNCRWVDQKTQSRNRRNVPIYEYNGVEFIQSDTESLFGIKRTTFQRRISTGMCVRDAIEKPIERSGTRGC